MKYKVGDKVGFEGRVGHITERNEYVYGYCIQSEGRQYFWIPEESITPYEDTKDKYLSALNRTKAFQMHFKRVRKENDELWESIAHSAKVMAEMIDERDEAQSALGSMTEWRDSWQDLARHWQSRFDELAKKSGERSMEAKEREETLRGRILKEQDDYAKMAGKYGKLIQDNAFVEIELSLQRRSAKLWKYGFFALAIGASLITALRMAL